MNYNIKDEAKNEIYELENNEEIDFKSLLNSLIRNKSLIIGFISLGFFLGLLKALTTERTWQGEFQIVVETKSEESSIASKIPQLASFGLESNNQLRTEIGILKSPYVLMNIFEFVKKQKVLNSKADKKAQPQVRPGCEPNDRHHSML